MEELLDDMYLTLARIYLSKGKHKTVVISGSVGKTSVTQAIATVLGTKYSVKSTKHNYNTHRGVPLTIFDQTIPSSRYMWIFLALDALLKSIFTWPKFTMLVLELGSDKPGDLAKFAFLKPTVAVVTAITPEHMENFKTIGTVAQEELTMAQYTSKMIVNSELVAEGYIDKFCSSNEVVRYGANTANSIRSTGNTVHITLSDEEISSKEFALIGSSGMSTLLASSVVAQHVGMPVGDIKQGLLKIRPVAGRMNKLVGLHGSTIIDDTYNSSPEAVRAALDYLHGQKATKKIVLLGSMNEMGDQSEKLHRQVGKWCHPKQIDLVVTLGDDANTYIAEEAEKNGCKVVRAKSPIEAGTFVAKLLSMGVVVLAKGSQNGVFAEEAVKFWLSDPADINILVRQTGYWPAKKGTLFVSNDYI